jgi:facilitated trehalose transporter
VAGGMAAASIYIGCFIAAKTFLSIEHGLQLYGSFWLFGVINCFCFAFLYFLLPETEGKSLEEIERLFAGYKHRVK